MAILENLSNNYYKICFEESFVLNGMAFANLKIYNSHQDRKIEKQRKAKFDKFFSLCENQIQTLFNLNNIDKALKLEDAMVFVQSAIYINPYQSPKQTMFSNDILMVMQSCGFEYEWILNPIKLVGFKSINCGTVQEFNQINLYGKLKTKMSQNISNV